MKFSQRSLQFKVNLVLVTLLILVIGALIAFNIFSLYSSSKKEQKNSAVLAAESIYNGIKYPMTTGNSTSILEQMNSYKRNSKGIEILIPGHDSIITFSSDDKKIYKNLNTVSKSAELIKDFEGMIKGEGLSRETYNETLAGKPYLTVIKPMLNEKGCGHCHGTSREVLGGVIVRMDVTEARQALIDSIIRSLLIGLAGIAVATLAVFLLISRLITRPINIIRSSLQQSSKEVSEAANQLSASSQSLAEGASENAAALEETSSSLEEISSMTQNNATNAVEANALTNRTNETISKTAGSMKEVTRSMDEIHVKSLEIGNVIKTIDEIAFQTNLLALNAAVEAARAGTAGAGFAVVAEEVRRLALNAAKAAKDTEDLMEDVVQKIEDGNNMIKAADEAFSEIITNSAKADELVREISVASGEQAEGIQQVNQAVAQMDTVTQQNAASSEESASASEQLNAQAENMLDTVHELTRLVDGGNGLREESKPGEFISTPTPLIER